MLSANKMSMPVKSGSAVCVRSRGMSRDSCVGVPWNAVSAYGNAGMRTNSEFTNKN